MYLCVCSVFVRSKIDSLPTFFLNLITASKIASGLGGHPGRYKSTGIYLSTPLTAVVESALNIPPVMVHAPIAITYFGSGICS